MSMNLNSSHQFLDVACELNEKLLEFESSSSSVKRTIFVRSYYATFIFLREMLKNNTDYISNPFGEHRDWQII